MRQRQQMEFGAMEQSSIEQSPILALPFITSSQNQKHITHNEALQKLDVIVQLSVKSKALTAPPSDPEESDRYIIGSSATGEWANKAHQIAAFQNGAWAYFQPHNGWCAWLEDEAFLYCWTGSEWEQVGGDPSEIQNAEYVGVNATADDTNRLSVSSPASLFNHSGAGHQVKVNKNAVADTASLLYQTNWSGRAEMGLTGDDDFSVKVSPDGSAWHDGLKIDRNSGALSAPNGMAIGAAGEVMAAYETGTWTPTLVGLTAGSATLSVAKGIYTRIGRLVMISLRIVTSNTASLDGRLAIGNLPFAAHLGTNVPGRVTGIPGFWAGLALPTGSTGLVGFLQDGDKIRLVAPGTTTGTTYLEETAITGTVTLYMSLTYMID